MRAVCYARVSTPGQAEGYSLQTQREATERLARELGATAVVHVEDTYTGTELDRPAMNELRELVRSRACDFVVVYAPDRFARDLTDLLIVTRELDRAGVRLYFVDFEWEDSPMGRLFLQLRGAIAEFEHALILERTQRGKAKKAALGKLRTYAQPYGYRFDKERDLLMVAEEEAAWVRAIYRWFVEEGLSTRAIARRLAWQGVPGPRGPRWSGGQVWRILRSRTYAGVLVRKDERPEWEPVRVPALVSPELWARAQELLTRARSPRPNAAKGAFLVQHLAVCGGCGRNLRLATTVRGARRWTYYRCPGRGTSPPSGSTQGRCQVRPVRADELDRAVWQAVAAQLTKTRWSAEEVTRWLACSAAAEQERLAEAKSRLRRAEEAERRVQHAYLHLHTLDDDAYAHLLGEAKAQARAALADVERCQAVLARHGQLGAARKALSSVARRLEADEDALPFPERRALVRDLVAQVVVRDDAVEIQGAFEAALPPFLPSAARMEKRAVLKLSREIAEGRRRGRRRSRAAKER